MFALVLVSLLFSVRVGNAVRGSSETEETICQVEDYCITLRRGEIRAEAGLCVVIPCSFNTSSRFTPVAIDWFKCEPSVKCNVSEITYSSYSEEDQSELRGRVTQLEPYIFKRNCSIIISDLTESDSGSYQLRVHGWLDGRRDGFQYSSRATVSVKALTQKPAVMIPPLTEGQQTTLSCTAPGLCSGSAPQITWMWRRGENDSVILGNFRTESLSAAAQRHSSTLTFTPSAEDHGTEVTCKVSFKNNISTEKKETLTVTFSPKILNSSACEAQPGVLTCVCISEGFPLPTVTWPLLNNHTQHCVTTSVWKNRVNSSITVPDKDHSYSTVGCVSKNNFGEVKKELKIVIASEFEQEGVVLSLAVVAALSLVLNVICVILVAFLWTKRRTVTPNKADRTYMSLQKTELSPEQGSQVSRVERETHISTSSRTTQHFSRSKPING